MSTDPDPIARQREALLQLVRLDKSSLDESIPKILGADARALDVERTSFWRLAADRSHIRCERLFRLSTGDLASGDSLRADQFPRYFAAMLENAVIKADDALRDPRTSEFNEPYFARHGITSLLDVPVWHRGQLVGVVCHEHVGRTRTWTDFEVDFARSIAGMIEIAIEAQARDVAERRYALLKLAMHDLVWDWDLASDEVVWSDAVFDLLRYKRGDVQDTLCWWRSNVHPQDLPSVVDSLSRFLAVGTGRWRGEYRFRRGDGTWAMIADQGVVERRADGTAVRMVGEMADITEQRLLHSQLALADRMASVGTLAAGVAHEINNPLTYVQANLNYALKLAHPHAPKLRAALEDTQQGLQRVQSIVHDLKTFSRADEIDVAPLDVDRVLESALRLAQNELSHRARVTCELMPLPPVLGNAARLGQVIVNLLINAAQAIPEGHVDQHEVVLRTRLLTGGRVAIEIRDTGSGVPPEMLDRVFDPFFTTKPVGEGTGLGLSISHSLVKAMGGVLSLENNWNKGATARVELKSAQNMAPAATAPVAEPAQVHTRARLLVVDDVANVGLSLQRLFSDVHDLDVMTSSRQALQAFEHGARWDVILCDLMMPELDGVDFCAALARLDRELLPRVVIMSGGAFLPKSRAFLASWPHGQLSKPFRSEAFLAEVARVVAAHGRIEGQRPSRAAG